MTLMTDLTRLDLPAGVSDEALRQAGDRPNRHSMEYWLDKVRGDDKAGKAEDYAPDETWVAQKARTRWNEETTEWNSYVSRVQGLHQDEVNAQTDLTGDDPNSNRGRSRVAFAENTDSDTQQNGAGNGAAQKLRRRNKRLRGSGGAEAPASKKAKTTQSEMDEEMDSEYEEDGVIRIGVECPSFEPQERRRRNSLRKATSGFALELAAKQRRLKKKKSRRRKHQGDDESDEESDDESEDDNFFEGGKWRRGRQTTLQQRLKRTPSDKMGAHVMDYLELSVCSKVLGQIDARFGGLGASAHAAWSFSSAGPDADACREEG